MDDGADFFLSDAVIDGAPAMDLEVSETLCMRLSPCGFDGSIIEPFGVKNSELIAGGILLLAGDACIHCLNFVPETGHFSY